MPYIKIKSFPKDAETKKKVVEAINQVFLEHWGCPAEAISISLEEVKPENWAEVEKNEVAPNADKMLIQNGVKKY
ncbi:MAG: tautomerase family protein [Paludibacteraceae bacterium]|nr:tautomerase family protein [Paludibacteraceae bacterium]